MSLHATHVGTATVLLEIDGVTLLTDPVFAGPCAAHFGWGMRSRHLEHPALSLADLPPIDLVLLSHDHHADNFDELGREAVAKATTTLTTVAAGRRLGTPKALGLRPWESHRHGALTITATPARHGPPLSLPLVGPVVGFVIEAPSGVIYVSGDTVAFAGIEEVARRFRVDTAFLHLGGAGYLGLRFTMDAREGAWAARTLNARQVIPIHYDGWTHFEDPGPENLRVELERAGLGDCLRILEKGARTMLA
jgi:L-ascorbate metabolism protein UlaG (beta-lactamase superfamily)